MKNHFAAKSSTAIWQENASSNNPFITASCRLHGYDLFDVATSLSYVESLFLLFKGELASENQARLLEQLMIFLMNPGPRHPATRAAMNAGVSKTGHSHILPIGLITMGGEHLGGLEVEASVLFLSDNISFDPIIVANNLLKNFTPEKEGDNRIAPGIGSRFNSVDDYSVDIANHLIERFPTSTALNWFQQFTQVTTNHTLSWLTTGIAAAVLHDLGIGAREACGLFQLMSAPGLLAHGLEQTHKPINAMPMIEDEDYTIEC